MNARVKKRDVLSQKQLDELTAIAIEEYRKHENEHGEGVARRVTKLFAQAMYEEYHWTAVRFQRVIDRVESLDASSGTISDLMSHIDQNLTRLGYTFKPEDPDKWVVT